MRTKVCLVCSHGGHLSEMLQLAEAFEECDPFYFCYDANTTRALPSAYRVPNKPLSLIAFVVNLARLIRIFWRERPDAIVSTGAEIAIPAALVGKVFRIPLIYIECGAQVYTPSTTGRLLYYVADRFYVQWPELLKAYGPKAQFVGSLIDTVDERAAA